MSVCFFSLDIPVVFMTLCWELKTQMFSFHLKSVLNDNFLKHFAIIVAIIIWITMVV